MTERARKNKERKREREELENGTYSIEIGKYALDRIFAKLEKENRTFTDLYREMLRNYAPSFYQKQKSDEEK